MYNRWTVLDFVVPHVVLELKAHNNVSSRWSVVLFPLPLFFFKLKNLFLIISEELDQDKTVSGLTAQPDRPRWR